MKNLIAELLVRLAEKEEASKELVAQVEALEIVVTALVRKLDNAQFQQITPSINTALDTATEATPTIKLEVYSAPFVSSPAVIVLSDRSRAGIR